MDTGLTPFHRGEILPNLVGGEAENGRDEADEGFSDLPEDGLRGAATINGALQQRLKHGKQRLRLFESKGPHGLNKP